MGVLPPDAVDHLTVLMVGGVGDGAGVDDAYIRFFTFLCPRVTSRDEHFTQRAGLRKIQFAP